MAQKMVAFDNGKPVSEAALLSEFRKPEQTVKEFMDDVKGLTLQAKNELAMDVARVRKLEIREVEIPA